jgi:hypothetical protein
MRKSICVIILLAVCIAEVSVWAEENVSSEDQDSQDVAITLVKKATELGNQYYEAHNDKYTKSNTSLLDNHKTIERLSEDPSISVEGKGLQRADQSQALSTRLQITSGSHLTDLPIMNSTVIWKDKAGKRRRAIVTSHNKLEVLKAIRQSSPKFNEPALVLEVQRNPIQTVSTLDSAANAEKGNKMAQLSENLLAEATQSRGTKITIETYKENIRIGQLVHVSGLKLGAVPEIYDIAKKVISISSEEMIQRELASGSGIR